MATFNLSNRILLTNTSPNVDSEYGTYASISDATTAITLAQRTAGKTIGIITDGVVTEYWWKDNASLNLDPVLKIPVSVGVTNLTTEQTSANFTIVSSTGDDAVVPLGDGAGAGASLNNYTTAEKNKLAGIATGAEVNVNADWNATIGDAQILNKPTISGTNTGDETNATIKSKLGITTLSGSNTGDQNLQSVTNLGASTTTPITANSFVKSGGTSSQILAADGSVITQGNNITITGGVISSVGGTGGGGSSVNYYLNGGTSQGTFGGSTYYEFSKTAVIGTGADFNISSDGYIASFITDVADPSLLLIPAGNWNLEFYFSSSSAGGTPSFYVELYKYNGTTFTSIASNSATPEGITGGTSIDAYFTSLAVPETILTVNDRLAIRVFVNASSKTITLHTQNGHLCQVITTFTLGLTALNGLQAQVQNFATGTTGSDFAIVSSGSTHTFNLPTASVSNRGALSSANWTTFNNKLTPNPAITGATKTKITYDANGLVTNGVDATTADIADSTNKRYVTDANLTVIGNTSGTNSGDNATNTQYSGLATSKQNTLVSTTNIKSINGNSILGSGNLVVSANQGLTSVLGIERTTTRDFGEDYNGIVMSLTNSTVTSALDPIGTALYVSGASGIEAYATNGNAIYAENLAGGGAIVAIATDGNAVFAESVDGIAVSATSIYNDAIYASSNEGVGVRCGSSENYGLHSSSGNSIGVYGSSINNTGVYGSSDTQSGVYGNSPNATGVYGNGLTGGAFDGSDYGLNVGCSDGTGLKVTIGAYSTQGILLNISSANTTAPAFTVNNGTSNIYKIYNNGRVDMSSTFVNGTIFKQQSSPASFGTATTLTPANLLTNIIRGVSGTSSISWTLPNGGVMESAVANMGVAAVANQSFDWHIVNTGGNGGAVILVASSGHTIVGNLTVAIQTSASYRTVRSAASTFITYRIS